MHGMGDAAFGDVTGQNINALFDCLQRGDTIIDGGNSNYRDSITRAAEAARRGMHLAGCRNERRNSGV